MIINQDNFSSIKDILEEYNPEYIVNSIVYKNIKNNDTYRKRTYLEITHKTCGHTTTMAAHKIIDNKLSCSKCAYIKKNKNDFKKEFYDSADGEYELLSEYQKATIKIKVKHLTCGHIYDVTPNKWLMGRRCPKCNANASHGEDIIYKLLTKNDCVFKKEFRFTDCRDRLPLPFDFAVFHKNIPNKLIFLIEFDGWGHYSYRSSAKFNKTIEDLKKVQEHDKIKTDYCLKNNIPLLRISEIDKIQESIEKMFNDYPDRE